MQAVQGRCHLWPLTGSGGKIRFTKSFLYQKNDMVQLKTCGHSLDQVAESGSPKVSCIKHVAPYDIKACLIQLRSSSNN